VHRNEAWIEIAAAPAEVFPWLAASERRCEWMGALTESEPLTEGSPEVGSRFRDVFEDLGRRVELEAEIVELEPPHAMTVHLHSRVFDATSSQRLEELEGGRTRLTAVIETEYKQRAARLAAPVVTRHAQRRLEQDLARLKELVEGR
jgi:uncharacterized protein YndB with AHSA1/START domain